jgi:hypothetical protein
LVYGKRRFIILNFGLSVKDFKGSVTSELATRVSDCVLDVDLSGAKTKHHKRAFCFRIYSKLSAHLKTLMSKFWATQSKSRLQLNHVLVHKTHSAQVRNRA